MDEVDLNIGIGLLMIALIIAIIKKNWYFVGAVFVAGVLLNFFYEADKKEQCVARGGKPTILGDCFEITFKKIHIK